MLEVGRESLLCLQKKVEYSKNRWTYFSIILFDISIARNL